MRSIANAQPSGRYPAPLLAAMESAGVLREARHARKFQLSADGAMAATAAGVRRRHALQRPPPPAPPAPTSGLCPFSRIGGSCVGTRGLAESLPS
jgi:hypothetical protein